MRPLFLSLADAPTDGVDEVQTIVLTGTPTGGTFTITFDGEETDDIAFNATAAEVQAALEALPTIGEGNVTCTGGPLPGTVVTITFSGQLSGLPVDEITATTTSLTAPDPTVVTIATTVPGVAATTDEEQTILIPNASGGTFTLTFDDQTTGNLAYNISNANLKSALEGLSNIDAAAITVSGGPLPALTTVKFDNGNVAQADVAELVADGALLTRTLGKTITTGTAGVKGTYRGAPTGAYLQDTQNGDLYVNGGTRARPDWNAVTV